MNNYIDGELVEEEYIDYHHAHTVDIVENPTSDSDTNPPSYEPPQPVRPPKSRNLVDSDQYLTPSGTIKGLLRFIGEHIFEVYTGTLNEIFNFILKV
jgi:hypothetical protein